MNPFEMVVLIVAIVMVTSVFRAKYRGERGGGRHLAETQSTETLQLREEVKQLKDRLAVLEQITIEKENSLSRQIEALRDK